MPLGNTEPFGKKTKTMNKSGAAGITLGKACIRDTSLTPDGWKTCDAAGANGPFTFAVDVQSATTDTTFTGSLPGTELSAKAGGTIEPWEILKTDASGDLVAAVVGTDAEVKFIAQYLGHENELVPTAASNAQTIRVRQIN